MNIGYEYRNHVIEPTSVVFSLNYKSKRGMELYSTLLLSHFDQ